MSVLKWSSLVAVVIALALAALSGRQWVNLRGFPEFAGEEDALLSGNAAERKFVRPLIGGALPTPPKILLFTVGRGGGACGLGALGTNVVRLDLGRSAHHSEHHIQALVLGLGPSAAFTVTWRSLLTAGKSGRGGVEV